MQLNFYCPKNMLLICKNFEDASFLSHFKLYAFKYICIRSNISVHIIIGFVLHLNVCKSTNFDSLKTKMQVNQ